MSDDNDGGEVKNRGGRPPKLNPNEPRVLDLLFGLGQIHATKAEMAAAFLVSRPTLNKFFNDHPETWDLVEAGQGQGRISLRRLQWQAAQKGNTTMQIWLGKQLLNQKDRVENTGAGGGPMQQVAVTATELTNMSDDDLAKFQSRLGQLSGGDGNGSSGNAVSADAEAYASTLDAEEDGVAT